MTGLFQKELGLYATALNNADLMVLARDVAKLLSAQYGSVNIDMIRAHPSLKDRQPSSPGFWGTVFNEKGWHCIGRQPSTFARNHAREIKIWTWKL